ncbi:hypothetical protein OEV98_11210 [Caldibacillus lycopersici]|uniref:Uncharacterized protein n=1 Tax=Perspicuibacillus lycopersici TaxID=1325689 RepID=A0AAE3IWE8_9BACI|nr:hypothetical protein [Perspicuibacillus lycopersici]MCU9614129.1 hypothetical protein [Perspicuibacillus lycopersici]
METPFYKKLWFLITVSAIIFFLIGLGIGQSVAKVKIDNKKMSYDQITTEIKTKNTELEDLENKINETRTELVSVTDEKNKVLNEINQNKKIIDEANEIINNRDSLTNEINDKGTELAVLDTDIKKKKEELDALTVQIKKTGEDPYKLGAGYYYFGSDIPTGRYELRAQDGYRGNIFVRGTNGISKVAETFGEGSEYSIESFVFDGLDGEEIEATIPIILVPVE